MPTEPGQLPHASTAPTSPSHSYTTPPSKYRSPGGPCPGKLHADWQTISIGVVAFNKFRKSYALRMIYSATSTGNPSAQHQHHSPKQYSAVPTSASTSAPIGLRRPGPTSLTLWHPIVADAVTGTWQKPWTISYSAQAETQYTTNTSNNSRT